MNMTFVFLKDFFITIYYLSPLLIVLLLLIILLGLIVGRLENWKRMDSIYYAFITATTIGYGDFRPLKRFSKLLSVLIGFIGLITSGIIVAVAVNSTTSAVKAVLGVS